MKQIIAAILFFLLHLCPAFIAAQSDHTLWYKQPAGCFEESMVLGNGRMGASVFGGVNSDKIYLNDATLWSGQPVNANMNPEAYKNLPAIRKALKNENYRLADKLNKKLQGKFSESYAPLGTLFINQKHEGAVQNYIRELNIAQAISKVSYEINGVKYTREYFVSYPDQVFVIKLSASQKGALNFDVALESLLKSKISIAGNILRLKGNAPVHIEPVYRNKANSIVYEDNKGTRFTALAEIKNTDGQVTSTADKLSLTGGTEAIIYISLATSFNGFDKDPATQGLNDDSIAADCLSKALHKDFEALKKAHIADYQNFFNRVSLNLGKSDAPDTPTDERLKRYAEGKEDKNLEVLIFSVWAVFIDKQFAYTGRSANLQGIWNPHLRRPGAATTPPTLILKRITGWLKTPIFPRCTSRCLASSKICPPPVP